MERAQKETVVGSIKEKFDRMTSAVFLDFKGLNVATVSKLRDEFRKQGVEYKVVKNTLIRHALQDKSYADKLGSNLVGMTGVAWSYEDPSAAAKVVTEFKKTNEKLQVKAGLIEGQFLDKVQVETQLATMPGKNELRAQLLATFLAPAQTLLRLLNTPGQQLAVVLDAKRRKDEGE